ncbi:MAG TPA: site-2 protease family protein [Gammaproteobacteria bacterium]|nr:site-2 protease family protein [Gammaproteobacteria bacterium]
MVDLVYVIASLALAMGFHEAMHAATASALGDPTARAMGRISLNPLRHIDPITTVLLPLFLFFAGLPIFAAARPVPFNPSLVKYGEYGAALVGVAGPLTNLALATVAGLFLRGTQLSVAEGLGRGILLFMQVNIGLFVFNMIPFPPLDGSRLLYAFAPEPLQEVMQRIESMGFLAIGLFIFLLFPFIAPLVSSANDWLFHILVG